MTDFVREKKWNLRARSRMHSMASSPQTAVTSQPVRENVPSKLPSDTPVRWKKVRKTGICVKKVRKESTRMSSVSIILSVTTVPTQQLKFVPSYRFSTPQRSTSPTRGTTRLLA